MKLYISYYGNYVTIVEGVYNSKKEKFNIKNTTILSSEDIRQEDKYNLLREALRANKSKSKNVVFSLNTRDVIIKSTQMAKVSPKDLDGIMNFEIYEMMSLHDEEYTFSYEVTNERVVDDKEVLDIVMAAISNEELENILDIFKEFKLNVERIDTMPTAYGRILKNVEYENIMMLNVGSYGSIVNIYENDSLFIHDNIPVRINEHANYPVSLALVDEVKGLMNFYSSRHFGKNVDTIVLLGESNKNSYVKGSFEDSFNSKIVVGIEKLFDIDEDIEGDLHNDQLSKVCDILGSMLVPKNKKNYAYMNLLPLNLRNKQSKQDKLKQGMIIAPVVLGMLTTPYFIIGTMENHANKNITLAQERLAEIKLQYKNIEDIDSQIKKAEEEIGIYDMLSTKNARWGGILSSIDKNIPYRVDLTNIESYYEAPVELVENEENSKEESEPVETPIYDQIPNVISIDGISKNPERIGQFVYSLNKVSYFESVDLINSVEDEENGGYTFNIILKLKEGAVSSE